jgi:glyoxylase-like metal-dependent hydrolase (beta-lactamase superfamily II)
MVCHCVLIESPHGLILVDSGLGLSDVQNPKERIGRGFMKFVKPVLDERETAIRQIEALGFRREDVRHIVLTHLDLDHAGGISDFPDAKVHVYRPEYEGATQRSTLLERHRYRSAQWAHHPRWQVHELSEGGENWKGFGAVRAIDEKSPDVLLVPLLGHTRGHCGVAIRTQGEGWMLHAGDAYFHHSEINPKRHRCPKALDAFQRLMAQDNPARLENQARLRALAGNPGAGVRIFSAHDPMELYREISLFKTP